MSAITLIIVASILFQLKHWLADFVFQTKEEVKLKGIYGNLRGVLHSAKQALGTGVVLLIMSLLSPIAWNVIAIMMVFDFVIHYHTDWSKVNFGSKNPAETRYWVEFGGDQLIHQFTHIFIIWWLYAR